MRNNISFKAGLLLAISCLSIDLFAEEDVNLNTHHYPTQNIARPGIMPAGIVEIKINTKVKNIEDNTKRDVSFDAEAIFGVVNNVQGSLAYDGFKTITLGSKWQYFAINHLSGSLQPAVPLHIFDGEILKSIKLGLPLVFYTKKMAAGILGDLFTLQMRPHIAGELNFPIWLGYQIIGDFWADISTSIGIMKMTNEHGQAKFDESAWIWQKMPLNLHGLFAINRYFDIGANVGFDDVFKGRDSFYFGLSLAIRGGKIFG